MAHGFRGFNPWTAGPIASGPEMRHSKEGRHSGAEAHCTAAEQSERRENPNRKEKF